MLSKKANTITCINQLTANKMVVVVVCIIRHNMINYLAIIHSIVKGDKNVYPFVKKRF